jgi:hypothetical protein
LSFDQTEKVLLEGAIKLFPFQINFEKE